MSRAVRFSHADRSELVTSEHVLLGVLDVEGTAGQVLRRLGADLDRLRDALETDDDDAPDPPAPTVPAAAPLVCHACGSALRGGVAVHELDVEAVSGVFAITAFGCAACGAFLGLRPR